MVPKSALGYDLISPELVGRDASITENKYNDLYLSRINQQYSLNEIFGSRKKGIAEGKWDALGQFTVGTPLRNAEGEDVLCAILNTSAKGGIWQPEIIDVAALMDTTIKTAEKYLQAVSDISPTHHKGMVHGGYIFGISVAQRGGFVLPTKYENKVIVLPTQNFIEYCLQQSK